MTQAYKTALANPNPVVSQGANVPQAPPPSSSSSVMQQFLANWKNQGSPTKGAGNYNNQGFYDSLQGMA